ncbi:hypothetical protein [Pseudomonas putida]
MTIKSLSIRDRISLLAGVCLLAVIGILILISVLQTQQLTRVADVANIRDLTEQLVSESERSAHVSQSLNTQASRQQSLMANFRV